jgi:hypothetical protein
MDNLLREIRMDATPVVVVNKDRKPFTDIIREMAVDTDLTILGMGLPAVGDEATYAERIHKLVVSVGSVLLVRNAETYDLLDTDN